MIIKKKQKEIGMNFLEEHNKKENRVAMQKERRKNFIQSTYKLVRNVVVAGTLIGVGIYFFVMWYFQEMPAKQPYEFDQNRLAEIFSEVTRPRTYNEVNFRMSSEFALLVNITNGRVLFEHRADESAFPASVTTIMNVMLGLEYAELDDRIVINADFDELHRLGIVQSGFFAGETRSLSEILHGIILATGAEAVWSLANHISGSYVDFVELMNEKARELGMVNTHFVTATGLHDDDHYTTAHDIAILLQYALENPNFREIFTARTYELENPGYFGGVLNSALFTNLPDATFLGGEILGGRTGATTPAGRCFASLATDGIDEYILITFSAPDPNLENPSLAIMDALVIYEYFLRVPDEY